MNEFFFNFTFKLAGLLLTLAGGLCIDHLVLIWHILTFFWNFDLGWPRISLIRTCTKEIIFFVSKSSSLWTRFFYDKNFFWNFDFNWYQIEVGDDNGKIWDRLSDKVFENWFYCFWYSERPLASVGFHIFFFQFQRFFFTFLYEPLELGLKQAPM